MRRLMEIIACLVLIAAWQAAIGGTWYVDDSVASPGDGTSWQTAFRTIQEGINAASHGDTVLVAAGTYVENIKFNGKNITLTSTEPLNPTVVQNTIIDGNKKASVVTFSGTEDETCILSGFTIRNGTGTATPYGKAGGGIYGGTAYYPTYATVENNIITSNSVDATGGGLSYCDGTVRNNKVTANYADSGGGLSDCNGTIQNNTVTGNSATSGGGGFYNCGGTIDNNTISDNSGRYGGGLQDCGGRIENNTISDNSGGDGGGLDNCDGTIQNNSITGNEAVTWGGGLRACDGTIRENTIARNTAQGGGGLDNCQGTIENNTVTSNSATSGGGGFYNCGGTIENNTITGNSASTGGGLCSCSGTIEDNTITDNEAGIGGGLSVCRGTMQNNSVSQNKAAEDGGGLQGCSGTIQNNVISGNSAGRDGGGLVGCGGAIQNNVIVGNSAGHWGGGLYECHGNIQNNTVVGNSAATGAGLYACDGAIRNCIVWGNTGQRYPQLCKCNEPSYSCIQGWTGGGEGNISDDPKFVDAAAGDYHVQAESPCIDRGINYYWFAWPQQDLDGNCRLVGERVDMGCYEYGSSADSDGDLLSDDEEETLETYADLDDCDYDGLRDGLEILRGTDPLDGWDPSPTVVRVPSDTPGIQRALCLAVDGDEVILEPGTYDANLVFCGANAILRSSQPENREMVASTIIDGGSRGSVVSLTGNESAECVISGLTIQNGRAGYGGGICGGTSAHSHATIKNNVITRNSAVRGGGGMASCDGYIQNNVITTNSAAYGGGLSQCHGTIESNIISGNSSGDYGGGGVAFCEGTIRGNAIIGNLTEGSGGGVNDSDGGIIEGNTICHNRAKGYGGGLQSCESGTIRNCIIWGNTAPEGPELIWSSAPGYSRVGGADPGFVDADRPDNNPLTWEDNDYHLAPGSPCIDKGRNQDWMWTAFDLDGNERIIDGDEDGSYVVDIGAYEYKFALRVLEVTAAAGEFQLRWNSRPGHTYIVSVCPDLATWEWIGVATVPSQGFTTSWADSALPVNRRMFYRIDLD